jgi:cell division protein FtsQ
MPSFARPRLRVLASVALVVALLAAGTTWLRSSSLVQVEHVTITGIDGRQATQIRDALTDAARDMTTLKVREDGLLDAVREYPIVRSLRTSADFPHRLRIEVNAYEPVAALRSAGSVTAVAGDGTLLRGTSTKDLPVVAVKVLPAGRRLDDAQALRSVRLMAAVPASLRRRVVRVFRGTRGLSTTVRDGPKLYFGGGRRLRAKWLAVAQVLANDTARGASYVDVRIPERPVAGGFKPRPAESSTSTSG